MRREVGWLVLVVVVVAVSAGLYGRGGGMAHDILVSPAPKRSAAPSVGSSAAPLQGSPMPSSLPKMTPVRHPGTGLGFDVPDDWKQEPKNEDTMIVSSPDGTASLVIFVVPSSAAEKVGDEIDKQLSADLADIAMDGTTQETETVNGLPQFMETGSARLKQDKKPVDLAVWMVKGKGDKSLMVIGMGDLKGKHGVIDMIRRSIHQEKP